MFLCPDKYFCAQSMSVDVEPANGYREGSDSFAFAFARPSPLMKTTVL